MIGGKRRTFSVLVAFVVAAVATLVPGPSEDAVKAGGRYTKRVKRIVPGLNYIKMVDTKLPARIKILKIDPTTAITLDVALSNNLLPGRERTSSMVARHGAIAGINASFGNSWGRPIGIFAEDGTLKASPYVPGGVLAFARGTDGVHIGHHDLAVRGRTIETGAQWGVPFWNDPNENRDMIAGWTRAGGDRATPEGNSCSMRLVPDGPLRYSSDYTKLYRRHRVAKQLCADNPMDLGKGLVLTSRRGSRGAQKIAAHNGGQHVRLSWTVGYTKAMDAVGGSPVLINDGEIIRECEGYVCLRHPRTGVGRLPDGRVLLVTVDGRSSDSVGMTVLQFARFFRHMGAVDAINMDGGGSSTMVLRGNIVNNPSDSGGERGVASSIIVHNGPDPTENPPNEPRPLPEITSAYSYVTSPQASALSMSDPASTGGLLDALSKGGFGGAPLDLSGDLESVVRHFRRGN
jgi:uncharacterized protein YigE (DUF2233 family)